MLRIIMKVQHDFELKIKVGYVETERKEIRLADSSILDADTRSVSFNLKKCFSVHMLEMLNPLYSSSARKQQDYVDTFEFLNDNFKAVIDDPYKICQFKINEEGRNPFCHSRMYKALTPEMDVTTIRVDTDGMFTITSFDIFQHGFKEIAMMIFEYAKSNIANRRNNAN
jgi:hypothetical protein